MLNFKASVVFSCVAFSSNIFATCEDHLANEVAKSFAEQHYRKAEYGPLNVEHPFKTFIDTVPQISQSKRLQLLLLDLELEDAADGTLHFDSDFTIASFAFPSYPEESRQYNASISLTQKVGNTDVHFPAFQAKNLSVTGKSNEGYSAFLLGSEDSSDAFNATKALYFRRIEHIQTAHWSPRKKISETKLKGISSEKITANGVIVDSNRGLALGVDQTNTLNIYALSQDNMAPGFFLKQSDVSKADGSPLIFNEGINHALSPNDFMYDPNTQTIAIRVKSGAEKDNYYQYFVLNKLSEGLYRLDSEAIFDTREPLPNSFAFLPRARIVAYRDAIGNFFIRHTYGESAKQQPLFEIKEPRALKKDSAISDEDIAKLQFPKVLSVDDKEGGSFIILKSDGNIVRWNTTTGHAHNFDVLKEFNKHVADGDIPGLVDGVTLNANGRLTAIWGENCIKIFDTLEKKALIRLNLPESAHGKITKVYFTPDSSGIFVQFEDGSATLVETKTSEVVDSYYPGVAEQFATALESHNLIYRN